MKKLFLLVLLPINMIGQGFVSVGVDPINAVFGSKVNDPAMDAIIEIGITKDRFQLQFTGEFFPEIDYYSAVIKGGYVLLPEKQVNIIPLLGLGMSYRPDITWSKEYAIKATGDIEVEYYFDKRFSNWSIVGSPQLAYRGELFDDKFIESFYIKIRYRF